MLNLSKDMGAAQGIRKDLKYEATVVSNNDTKAPDGRMLCRIQARIAGMFDGIPDENLPWAIPNVSHADGASSTSGSHDVPKIGTKVLLMFQEGSSEHPMYEGYIVDSTTSLDEMVLNYPDRKVIRYKSDVLLVIDTKTNEIFIRNPGNFNLFIEGDANLKVMGNVVEKVMGNRTSYVKGNLIEIVDGNKMTLIKGNEDKHILGSSHSHVNGNQGEYIDGSYESSANGSRTVFTAGADAHHSASSILRTAPYINDDLPAGGPLSPSLPGDPSEPVLAPWPGIRGSVPS